MKKRLLDYSKRKEAPFYIDLQMDETGKALYILFPCPTQKETRWEGFQLFNKTLEQFARDLYEEVIMNDSKREGEVR